MSSSSLSGSHAPVLEGRSQARLRSLCLISGVVFITVLSGVFASGEPWLSAWEQTPLGRASVGVSLTNASASGNTNFSSSGNESAFIALTPSAQNPAPATYANWPTYEYGSNRSGYNQGENTIAPANASSLGVVWNTTLSGPVFGGVSVVNGTAYVGSWDGYEYALSAANGSVLWKSFLGVENFTNTPYGCPWASPLGVTSTAAVYGGSVYVGGFYDYYSLNASTGRINWNVSIDPRNATASVSDGYYAWSSPAWLGKVIYVGVASQCDNPLVRARVMEIWASNGTAKNYFNTVVASRNGSSVWSSPTLDIANNTLWVTTGNGPAGSGNYGQAIVALNATTLKLQGEWAVPSGPPDIDFGAGGSLFVDSSGNRYVVATNKDGYAYALNRLDLTAGPVWKDQTTTFPGPASCQPPGQSIAPALSIGSTVYLGSSYTKNGTISVNGSIRAVYPSNGTSKWETATDGTVQAAVTGANGLVVDVSRLFMAVNGSATKCYSYLSSPNSWLQVLNASTGHQLYSYHTSYEFAGAPAIADGRIFVGAGINDTIGWTMIPNHQGHVLAFGLSVATGSSTMRAYTTVTSCTPVEGFGNVTGGMPGYNYTWTWGDGSAKSYGRDPPTHCYWATGHWTAEVGVTDAAREFSGTEWYIYDYLHSCGPAISFCWTTGVIECASIVGCLVGPVGPVSLAADVTGYSGTLTWSWNFGDGSSPSEAPYPVHTYAEHGTYTVTVQVTDSEHHQTKTSFSVTV
ncbi:MAG: PKD domain-containing protein [Thermoplasmata archaeon]|nr:PKD domain-containing protein [Thermoplasmata archaeon]